MFGKKKAKTKVFGVPLAESVLSNRAATSTNLVADVVYDVINYLEKHEFLSMEGIYRVPGRQSRLEALRESYDKGRPIDLEKGPEDPFTCADLLLLYLRSLPEPLVPQPMAGELEQAGENLSAVKSVLFRLPPPNRVLLSLVARHAAQVVAAEASNKMGLKNVIIVFVPSLFCSPRVFSVLVDHAAELFVRLCSGCGVQLSGESDVVCATCEGGGPDGEHQSKSSARASGLKVRGGLFGGNRHSRGSPSALAGKETLKEVSLKDGKEPKRPVPPIVTPSAPLATSSSAIASPPSSPLPRASPRGAVNTTPPSPRPVVLHVSGGSANGGGGGVGSGGGGGVGGGAVGVVVGGGSVTAGGVGSGTVFGVDLAALCRRQTDDSGSPVVVLPSLVRQCWKLVEASSSGSNGARGVYSAPLAAGAVAVELNLAGRFESGARVTLSSELNALLLSSEEGVHVAGALLLRFCRALPTSPFSSLTGLVPASLSRQLFGMSLEERTFVLHFVSHMRTVVKLELNTPEVLAQAFAGPLRCSTDLLLAIYNNRRTILQPSCVVCEKIVQLFEPPEFDGSSVTCKSCAAGKKKN